ncbi:Uncharacterized protein ImpH/VasB [hydrothermal vent metagenome]|uniref:Uncharacterized protein ImpH/VasB n=1 Tax=hydrothermal vent metagenome TaxID=652676 RepID=A0A1W1BCT9_9ZZZZ
MHNIDKINSAIQKEFLNSTLPMGIHLVYQYLRDIYPQKSSKELYEHIEFKSNPSLSFQKSEISNIKFIELKDKVVVQIEINFLGLFGTATPLPIHYAEEIIDDSHEDMVLVDFLNLFNHHLQKFIYSIWERHRYYIKYEDELRDNFSKYILSILGLYSQVKNRDYPLNLHKLLPFAGIISMKQRPTTAIIPIIKHYIGHDSISIDEYLISKAIVPNWQKNRVGEENCSLGEDMIIGEFSTVCNLKFRINLNDIPWNYLYDYSYQGKRLGELKYLIDFLLKEPLDFELSLNIKKSNIKKFYLNEEGAILLGVNSWIGEPIGDAKVIKEI